MQQCELFRFSCSFFKREKCHQHLVGDAAPTELTIVSSQKKQSLVLVKNLVIFTNSIGDLTAVDSNNGEIIWQTPTQVLGGGQHITLRNSEIVSDGETIFISNNNNEFFSLDIRTGVIKWKQQINSEIRPVVVSNYIICLLYTSPSPRD